MAKNVRADESILNPATSTGTSLRTTIPAWIIAKFEIKKGDKFRWHIMHEKDYEYIAIQVMKKPNISDELGIE